MKLLTIGLLLSLLIDYSIANCIIDDKTGLDITINNQDGINDDATEFITVRTENVESIELLGTDTYKYVTAEYSDNAIYFKPTSAFANFELETDYTPVPRVSGQIKATCADTSTVTVTYHQTIKDVNNHQPEFRQPTFRFKVPVPFPGGVALTEFGEDIFATDIDVTNTGIDFKILGDGGNYLYVDTVGTVDSKGKEHRGIIRTKSSLRITDTVTYKIQATDRGIPTLFNEAEIIIEIDPNGSVPTSPEFQSGYYTAQYENNAALHSITDVKIPLTVGITKDDIQLSGDYNSYFTYEVLNNELHVNLISNLPAEVITDDNFIILGIAASIANADATARTSLIVTMPPKITVEFDEILYKADYNKDPETHVISDVFIDVTNEAEITLQGDYKEHFQYNNVDKSIKLISNLPETVINNNNYVEVIIQAEIGSNTAKAALIVSMPQKTPLEFNEVYYTADYNNEGNQHAISEVTINVNKEATITLDGAYKEYFEYKNEDKSITLKQNLLEDVIDTNHYIDVIIQATDDYSTVNTVLIVSIPDKLRVEFDEIYYQATYNDQEDKHTISEVTIGVNSEATVTLQGVYKQYFDYNSDKKSITLIDNIPADIIETLTYIDITIKAEIGTSSAEAILIVSMPDRDAIAFNKIYYEATYDTEETNHAISEVFIDITDEAAITLQGDYSKYFQYNDAEKSIKLIENIPENIINTMNYVDVTIKAELRTKTAEAVLIVSMPSKVTLGFNQIYYQAKYNDEATIHTISEVIIDVADEATITLEGDYKQYFEYNDVEKSIKLIENIPDNLINTLNYVDVIIKGEFGMNTAEAVLIVSTPDKAVLGFNEIYYQATYNNEGVVHTISEVIIDVADEATITLEGDYKQYFEYNDVEKSIKLIENIPDNLINTLNYVDVIIKGEFGMSTAEAVLIVSTPGKAVLGFNEIYYQATYNNEGVVHTISEVIIDVADEATITLEGDYKQYFEYNDMEKSIKLIENIPDNLINTLNYVDVIIKGEFEMNTAEAVLIVSTPGKAVLGFNEIYYQATYNNEGVVHTISEVIIDVADEATITLEGDYNQYFEYNDMEKSIKLIENIPDNLINTLNYVDVIIKGEFGINTAKAVLVVSLPSKAILGFNEIYYQATYNTEGVVHTISEVIIDVVDEATITLEGDYKQYFEYNDVEKSIKLIENIPDNLINTLNYVDVIIKGEFGMNTAEAVLVVSMPGKAILGFNEIYYQATYNNEDVVHTMSEVIIDVADEATITLEGDYKQYFEYNDVGKSIKLIENIPDNLINTLNYVDVIIKGEFGMNTAKAVLVVSMPGKAILGFNEIYYQATYNNEDVVHTMSEVIIDVADEATITLEGDYKQYFEYNDVGKSIKLIENIPDNLINTLNYVDVIIKGEFGMNTAKAVLVVSMPGKAILGFNEVYYQATYNNEGVVHTISEVIIDVADEATITLEGDYKQYFEYNEVGKSIKLIENIPDNLINTLNYVDVIIKGEFGMNTAKAVLVVSMPGKAILGFNEIYYQATYNNEGVVHTMSEVIIDVADEATITLEGDYKQYFEYNEVGKSIKLIENIPDNLINTLNYVDVIIKGEFGMNTAKAVLVVSMPGKAILGFNEIYYQATYNNEGVVHTMSEVIINVADEATITLEGDYKQYFEYDDVGKSIKLIENIPDNLINTLNYVDVIIKGEFGMNTAEAVLVVSMPGKAILGFNEIYYQATYNNEDVVHTMSEVIIDVADETTITLEGDYKQYFEYNDMEKSIKLIENIPDNLINTLNYVDVIIKGEFGINTAKAVLVVSMPGKAILGFNEIYYQATYNNEGVVHTMSEVIIDVADEATITLEGDYKQYFVYNDLGKSIKLIENIPDNLINTLNYVDVIIKGEFGMNTAKAVLVVSMPGKAILGFNEIYYQATYNNEGVVHTMSEVIIDVADEATITLEGDYKQYFEYNDVGKSIKLIENIPDNLINTLNYVDVIIKGEFGMNTAEAVLVVSMPGKAILGFNEIYYQATYNNEGVVHTMSEVIIDVADEATITLEGDYKQYFEYNDVGKSIKLIENIPDNLINTLNYVDVIIKGEFGMNTAEAVLVVSMPGKAILGFNKIYYQATYNNEEVVHTMSEVIIDVADEVTITLEGDYKQYFEYNDVGKSIKLIENIPDNLINTLNYVDVIIKGEFGINTAEAVLVVSMPGKAILGFNEIYYQATYNNEEVVHTMSEVIIDVADEVTITLEGDYKQYFEYNDVGKSIKLIENIPDNLINTLNYVDVIIIGQFGMNTAEAVLVVSMPGKAILGFNEIYYQATYHNEEVVHTMSEVIINVADEATITLEGDYKQYFEYNDVGKSIKLIENIPDNLINTLNYVDVIIKGEFGMNTAEAVLVVSMPGKAILGFNEIYYQATYNNEGVVHTMSEVIIDVADEATITLEGDYKQYFEYNDVGKSIKLIENIPDNLINTLNYVDVIIKGEFGMNTAKAVLVVSMPGKAILGFNEIYYEATYNNEGLNHAISEVIVDVTNGAVITLQGAYRKYFEYNDGDKSIKLIDNLPDSSIDVLNYIYVIIQADFGTNTAEAVLVVSMPGKAVLGFNEVYYQAAYNNEEDDHLINEVTIDVTNAATITLEGAYKEYFEYNDKDKSIILTKNLPENIIDILSYIDVIIQAEFGTNKAKAILIVSMPGKAILGFNEIYYQAKYNDEGESHAISEVTIDVTNGAIISLEGYYKEHFEYNSDDRSITLTKNLPENSINTLKYIDVIIQAEIGDSTAEAVLIVSMPGNAMVIFGEIYYQASYSNENDDHTISIVVIDVSNEVTISLQGVYGEYFEYDAKEKSIKLIKNLPESAINTLSYVDIIIHGQIDTNTAEAILIVSLPAECGIPPPAVITFDDDYIFKTEPSVDIDEQVEAKSTIVEEISYKLIGDVPREVVLSSTGRLQTISLPTGFYDLQIIARGSLSKATATTSVKIYIGIAEICPEGIKNYYSFLATSVEEEKTTDTLLVPKLDGYHFEIENIIPNSETKFGFNDNGDFVAKTLDRESDEFTNGRAQYIARILLVPDTNEVYSTVNHRTYIKSILNLGHNRATSESDNCYVLTDIKNEVNKITVGITVEDINDHAPEFLESNILTGYPEKDLLSTVLPPYLLIVEATDKDTGLYASLSYTVNSDKVVIDSKTGYIYPTDKIYDIDNVIKVTATDEDGQGLASDPLLITIEFLEREHITNLKYRNKNLEDLDNIMNDLKKYADVRYLSATVLPGYNSNSRAENSNDRTLSIIAYAFDFDQELLTFEELKEMLGDIDGLTIEPLPTDNGNGTTPSPGDSDDDSNTGLIAAVSVLAVLLVLCLIGFIAFYFLKFRKSKPYNRMEEDGLPKTQMKESVIATPRFTKNTGPVSSTSPKSDVDITTRRPTGYLHPSELAEERPPSPTTIEATNGEMKERRKSVVFNSNVEEINIEREAENQDGEKKDETDNSQNNVAK